VLRPGIDFGRFAQSPIGSATPGFIDYNNKGANAVG